MHFKTTKIKNLLSASIVRAGSHSWQQLYEQLGKSPIVDSPQPKNPYLTCLT